jgi:hypothetical protein
VREPWHSDSEDPTRVIGTLLLLREPDGLGPDAPELPPIIVHSFSGGVYEAEFARSFDYGGQTRKRVSLSARHAGYPVSGVSVRGITAVNAEMDGDVRFIAVLNRPRT